MSDDDAAPSGMGSVLACEVCRKEFTPEQFGRATVAAVPHNARSPCCGALLMETDPDDDV